MPDESVDYHFHPEELMLVITHRYFRGQTALKQTLSIDLRSSIVSLPSASSSFPIKPATLILCPPCRMRPRAFAPQVLARRQI